MMTRAWIYQPYGHHWGTLNRKNVVEILAGGYIPGIIIGNPCRIHVLNNGDGLPSTSKHYLRELVVKQKPPD
jgi:hypothetical protein